MGHTHFKPSKAGLPPPSPSPPRCWARRLLLLLSRPAGLLLLGFQPASPGQESRPLAIGPVAWANIYVFRDIFIYRAYIFFLPLLFYYILYFLSSLLYTWDYYIFLWVIFIIEMHFYFHRDRALRHDIFSWKRYEI